MNRLGTNESEEDQNELNQTNPWTDRPYSHEYFKILKQRQKLPVYEFKEKVIEAVRKNKITIIEGSTGSGKTTQIPQFLLESDILGTNKKVICTQPRQVAAINVAMRVAQEMDVELGSIVGYCVRFDAKVSEKTRLKYMTDGLLLREFISDRDVSEYSIIVIDEAHERNINSDIILGLVKQLCERRDDIRVVVMSATLEVAKFTNFFNDAPHLLVPGRLHPVQIIYTPESVANYVDAAITTALKIHREEPEGDILIFLTGEEEIETACDRIREGCVNVKNKERPLVLPLYASLPPRDQQRIFRPAKNPNQRKIIVSTNIAETSVTIDGVVYVIDPGFVKQSQYQPERRMSALLVTPISKASANQRSGRAGRTKPGKCYRLYPESAYNSQLVEQTVPEIQRSDLGSVILLMLATGITDVVHFPFIDKPPHQQLLTAVTELYHLGALNDEAQLTEVGQMISTIPVEPKHAKCLVASKKFGCTSEIATIVSLLDQQGSVLFRPRDQEKAADLAHANFKSTYGDHITFLNVYDEFVANGRDKNWCDQNYINYKLITRADKTRGQLVSILRKYNIDIVSVPRSSSDREKLILRGLLEGLFLQTSMLNFSSGCYLFMVGSKDASIHPSSCLRRKPEWIVWSDYIFTTKAFVRTVSEIQPEWLLEASPSYFAPENLAQGQIKLALDTVRRLKAEKEKFK
ncbi:helicase [Tritrichomonas foetus]|uniref:RNA helicase n=1 Tax=Tritrichomonas foetus TaxID=1144522 RepID=A0A1J4KWC6_9EUKA|nr:helicase [Tritrichomonas foetus]|eukprot:OHT14006.1 helicase [Tritrichomonas foetus]